MNPLMYGMPTLLELPSMEANAALCRALGLSFIELNMNLPQYQADAMDLDALHRIAQQHGLYYTLHLEEALSPCDVNPRIARAYTETALQAIGIARRLNMPIINMHLAEGIYFTLPEGRVFLFEQYKGAYLAALRAFRDACEAAIGGAGILICVENTDGWGRASFLAEGVDLLLESPVFALTLDIGHNATAGGGDEPWMLSREGLLRHMHLHDALPSQQRNHLPFGAGALDLPRYLALAQARGCRAVLETKTVAALRQSVAWLQKGGWMG
ncbi:MAG: sugar phosphate isomerase/epimerase [Oscillospiraceae bacterium]|nr:sugar phosphate isomerase/epimerase [Oscillospiraceae bacterium]